MNSKEMVKIAYEALSDKKGQDIKIIDIQSVSVLADYFIIADGSNPNQVQAMADNVEEMLGKAGCECKQIEWLSECKHGSYGLQRYYHGAYFLPRRPSVL